MKDDERIVISTEDARAGSTPNIVRYILGISLVLIVVVFAAIAFFESR